MTSQTPSLSIVMPAYNAERYIDRAIDSVLAQTFTDFELVIVDDVSSDRTLEIIERRSAGDERIRVFRNEANHGAAQTIHRGIELSRAPLIGRLDADDISTPNRFEKQIALMRANPHYAVVGCYASHINENDDVLSLSATGPSSEAEFNDLRLRGEPTMVFGGSALFTRKLYDAVGGFDTALVHGEDLELFDRMSDHGPVIAIPEPLLLYRLHEASLVRRTFFEGRQVHRFVRTRRRAAVDGAPSLSYAEFVARESERPVWRRARTWLEDHAQLHYREGGMAYGNGNRLGFVRHLLQAFIADPVFVSRRLWDQRFSPAARLRRQRAM